MSQGQTHDPWRNGAVFQSQVSVVCALIHKDKATLGAHDEWIPFETIEFWGTLEMIIFWMPGITSLPEKAGIFGGRPIIWKTAMTPA